MYYVDISEKIVKQGKREVGAMLANSICAPF
jgi:hypothetical protein